MSSEAVSFFDWEMGFKNSDSDLKIKNTKKSNLNSIGMTDDAFRRQLNKWKSRNL